MFGTEHLGLSIATGLLLNITPGQDTLYIVGRSVSQGRRAGLLSVLGISSGCLRGLRQPWRAAGGKQIGGLRSRVQTCCRSQSVHGTRTPMY